jgi:hypothetical protein
MPVLDEWDEEAGDWKPDEWDRKVHAVLAWRDHIADSVDGPVPEFGTPEWAAADERTQAAAFARHEREVAAAQGVAISNRMAAVSARREAQGDAEKVIATEWARRHYSEQQLRPSTREQRNADQARRVTAPKPWEDGYDDSFPTDPAVPAPRQPSDARECVQRASTAVTCAVARQDAARASATGEQPTRGRVRHDAEPRVDVQT